VAAKRLQRLVRKPDAIRKADDELSKAERTRECVLSAAGRLFRQEGFYATTMRDIAQESGVEAGSIYYHFQSKDQILNEVLDLGVRQLYEKVREITRSARRNSEDFRKTFALLIETHLTYLEPISIGRLASPMKPLPHPIFRRDAPTY
jgi:TetR/AcrR family transcriptional regulator, cholesterol catabolism regulator